MSLVVVVNTALVSRAAVILAMLFWSNLCKPYDSSAALHSTSTCLELNISSSPLSNSVVWDAVYYLRIARCGYEYEQMHAFQPLLPLLISFMSNTVFRVLVPFLGYDQTLVLSGYTINFLAFILAAVYLYRLGLYVLQDESMAYLSTAFFCFNPASGNKWRSAVLFGLSSISRSNGVLHAGFFVYQAVHLCYRRRGRIPLVVILNTVLQAGCVVAPFICFQAYGYYQLCYQRPDPRPWCSARVPYLYGFVQSHYWDVGFLRYFQVKQIPNFLSASPALCFASAAIVTFARNQPVLFCSAGLGAGRSQWWKAALLPNHTQNSDESTKSFSGREIKPRSMGFFSAANVPFVLELMFMTGVAFFVMHVQVSTRFLSSSPVIYWFAAHMHKKSSRISRAIWSVFFGYILVGTLLFINFYPFT